MFHLFRSRKQTFRILLGVIVAPIIITMVVTLIPGIFGSSSSNTGGDTVLAKVGSDSLTVEEAQQELQDQIRTRRLPPGAASYLPPQVVQDKISEKTLLQEAARLGVHVTEPELAEHLQREIFRGAAFDREQYNALIQQRFQKTVPQFEDEVRKALAITKLRRLVTDGVTVSPAEVEQEYKRRKEKARIEYAALNAAALQSTISPSQGDLEEHYKKNLNLYQMPERRTFQYMILDDAKVGERIKITPQELERYYNENKDRFRIQERVRVTHILLKTTDKKEDEIKKMEAKAQDLLKQVRSGKDFAELAKANSEDESSAKKGGEIGWITRGQTVPEFEQKAFTMKAGEVSDVVKTQYGLHIIKMLEHETGRLKPFAEVQPTILQELRSERVDMERMQLAEKARAAATRHPGNLQEAGREVGLPVLTATLVARNSLIPEIGAEPGFMDAVFTAVKGMVIGPVQLAGKSVIAAVTTIEQPRQAQLAEILERVKYDVTVAKAGELAEERAKQLAERAKALGDLQKAAKEMKLEVKKTELFTRDGSIPGLGTAASIPEAFTAPPHSLLGPKTVGADRIVFQVVERVPADARLMEVEGKGIRETMLGTRQNEVFEVFRQDLLDRQKKQGKIKIFQDRVDRFVASNRATGPNY